MPDRATLPRSCASWAIDPGRAALLVHDMQNHFVGEFPTDRSPVVELVENITALRALATALGIPIFFTAEAAQPPGQRGLAADVWGPGIGDGTERRRDHPAAHPAAGRACVGQLVLDDGLSDVIDERAIERLVGHGLVDVTTDGSSTGSAKGVSSIRLTRRGRFLGGGVTAELLAL